MKRYENPKITLKTWEEYLADEGMPDELPQERDVRLANVYLDDEGNEVSELDFVADNKADIEKEVCQRIKINFSISNRKLKFVRLKYEKRADTKIPEMEF